MKQRPTHVYRPDGVVWRLVTVRQEPRGVVLWSLDGRVLGVLDRDTAEERTRSLIEYLLFRQPSALLQIFAKELALLDYRRRTFSPECPVWVHDILNCATGDALPVRTVDEHYTPTYRQVYSQLTKQHKQRRLPVLPGDFQK